MTRKCLSVLLCLAMLFQVLSLSLAEESVNEQGNDQNDLHGHTFEVLTVPTYFVSTELTFDFPLYFRDQVMDLPYVEVRDLSSLLVTFAKVMGNNSYGIVAEMDGSLVLLTRENGCSMLIDFDRDVISFDEYDGFTHLSIDTSIIDSVNTGSLGEEDSVFLRVSAGSYDRLGFQLNMDLSAYGIELFRDEENELYLLPLHTMTDILLPLSMGSLSSYYNGKQLFIANGSILSEDGEWTEIGELLWQCDKGEKSPELAEYSYRELCFLLDQFYGLKETHQITSFDDLFTKEGLKGRLLSTDPVESDVALDFFIENNLDDLHSGFSLPSYLYDEQQDLAMGLDYLNTQDIEAYFREQRQSILGDVPFYQEVGNTAYITFDGFHAGEVNYRTELDKARPDDTIAQLIRAHEQLTREDSPVTRVVLDLSCNGGGDVDAAVFVLAWMLGEAPITIANTLTGASSTVLYRADTDLNGLFDERDTVTDRELFCLISPVSFSCGNAVPCILKDYPNVTLLGQTSGGGSCVVMKASTAYGSSFQLSSPLRISRRKNGSLYDVDRGVEPDVYIANVANFYNREALNEYLDRLF